MRRSTRPLHALALAVVGLLVVGVLSSCSSAVDEASGASGDSGPSDGGTLRIGSTSDIVPASIFTNSSDATNTLIGAVYDSLIDYPLDNLDPEPRLATSWQVAKDGLSITLQLRDDVKFHTGREFTSKDVEFSIKTWADPTWTVQLQRTAAAITGFDTSDPHAITLTFDHKLSNIFDLLDMVPIIDSETFDQLKTGKAYVGTGPFVFKSWTPSSKLTFTKNPDYWGDEPHLDGIEVDIVSDPQAQVSQLRSGQLDLVTGASNRDLETLGKDSKFSVTGFDGAVQQIYVGADLANPDLQDVKLRQAIAYAIDRERIVDEVFRGQGTPINLPWPDYSPAYDAEANKTYTYDPAKAKALVAQLGDSPTIPLAYPAGNANYEAVAQIVQSDLEAVGIKTQLQPAEYSQFIKQLIGGTFGGLWILQHGYAHYTPSTLAVSAYPFNADKNASHFVSKDYKEHADAAWNQDSGSSPEAVAEYKKLNKDLLDNLFLIEMALLHFQTAETKSVHGLNMSKRGELDLRSTYLSD
ncbi:MULTISPECIES: ABC transporter substrate-binding protein [unclassified Nocardioides]|uniref:ABC transporter substrate-binding protein n=1 Tax=unclassified Nocardioides TaxID=2615069 RepID=UPI000A8A2AFA|nr:MULTISPECIES: ABC transporter substrate-binding protein [unclassified Nocardioides]